MLYENLKAHRKAKGLTQEELAIRLSVVRQTVSKWETGQSVPDADILIRIADVFEVTVSELLGAKMESEKDIGDIAMQLSRINEQLAVINRRARFIWKAVSAGLAAVFLVGAFIFLLNAAGSSPAQPSSPTSPAMSQDAQIPPLDNLANLPADNQSNNSPAVFQSNSSNQTYGIADYASSIDELPDLIYVGMDGYSGNDSISERAYIAKAELLSLMPERGQIGYINDVQIRSLNLYSNSGRPLRESIALNHSQNITNSSFFSYLLPTARDCFGEFAYRTNDNGKTYGKYHDVNLVGSYPELIEAIAADGTIGYVYADDMIGTAYIRGYWMEPLHGEGAVEFIDISPRPGSDGYVMAHGETGSIPLYALDGTSVIGEVLVLAGVRFAIRLTVGGTYWFNEFELPGYLYGSDIEQIWESSDTDVFIADPQALEITAVGPGTAMLSVTAGDRTDRFIVFVTGG